MNTPGANLVRDIIQRHQVVVFGKGCCPFSQLAKRTLESCSLDEPVYMEYVEYRKECEEILNVLGKMTGNRTVPRCFVKGKFVGGALDVKRMCEDGSLKKLLG